jgi:hypothetical protein
MVTAALIPPPATQHIATLRIKASFRVGRVVEVIVVLRSSVCLTRHMRRSARDPSS